MNREFLSVSKKFRSHVTGRDGSELDRIYDRDLESHQKISTRKDFLSMGMINREKLRERLS